jgi:NADP-dependent 3-hydroxy acid dehydrogenase YdfG
MIGSNRLGAMTATEVFLDQLRDGGGDLVNVSSVAGRVAPAGFAAYAPTEWGINGWSEALRVELQPDIRVTVIEPGAITTELTDHITDPASKRANQTATAEMGIPAQDIADVIAFAVSRAQRVTLNEILVRPTAQASESPQAPVAVGEHTAGRRRRRGDRARAAAQRSRGLRRIRSGMSGLGGSPVAGRTCS